MKEKLFGVGLAAELIGSGTDFCNHKEASIGSARTFASTSSSMESSNGDLEQIDREKNLINFRSGAQHVLIATDLAARGLDIPEIQHVVHYQLPMHHDAFLHRNGRTARMAADGEAYIMLADDEVLPAYIEAGVKEYKVSRDLHLPPLPEWVCLYISAGKKEKIRKGDIAGMLIQKGKIKEGDVGLITILDHSSYVSVRRSIADRLLVAVRNEKLKKQRIRIDIAR